MEQVPGKIEFEPSSGRQALELETTKKLMAALIELKRGDCWCEVATGNPMMSDHSRACKNAAAVLLEARTVFGIPNRGK